MSKSKLKQVGIRTECLEGCGHMVLRSQPICRKCRRKNRRRVAKIELRERKQNAGYVVKDGYEDE